jgi:hypothetical protein
MTKMTKMSSSPERYSFTVKSYHEKLKVNPNDESAAAMIDFYDEWKIKEAEQRETLEWQTDNLEYDLRTTDWILEKVRNSESYAQNLYAAMCNREFMKVDVVPILMEKKWGCSWRSAGGIIANMRQEGDYIDWYCSGIGNDESGYGLSGKRSNGYVPESVVTEEIEADLLKLQWRVLPEDNDF